MRLYNTLTRKIEDIKPINPPEVTVYTCGPTVYDYPHIGNWFTFIRYDTLIRTLKSSGLKPRWVMNITDVGHLVSDEDEGEDKLEVGAKREGKSAWDIAAKYTDYFIKGLSRLNKARPDNLEKATAHINEQIELVKKLETKGYTYVINDGVYYDTSKFPNYGQLARLDISKLKAGARVAYNPQKKNPTDFALWKFSPKDTKRDMEWDSPWGKGFPGWHLECSAISMEYLGDTIDIHAGGIDHIPVHHTNEIAQSEAASGKTFVHYWMHTNFSLVNNHKMAKSLNNFFTLEDIEKKGFSLEAFRLLVLESHYRTEAEFSWDILEAAQNRLNSYKATSALQWQVTDKPASKAESFADIISKIKTCLQDDLNSGLALTELSAFSDKLKNGLVSHVYLADFKTFLKSLDQLMGFELNDVKDISRQQKALIQEREMARKEKDWNKSDQLRSNLENQKIGLRDTEYGPIWFPL